MIKVEFSGSGGREWTATVPAVAGEDRGDVIARAVRQVWGPMAVWAKNVGYSDRGTERGQVGHSLPGFVGPGLTLDTDLISVVVGEDDGTTGTAEEPIGIRVEHGACGWGEGVSSTEDDARHAVYEEAVVDRVLAVYPTAEVELHVDRRSDLPTKITIHNAPDFRREEEIRTVVSEAMGRAWQRACEAEVAS